MLKLLSILQTSLQVFPNRTTGSPDVIRAAKLIHNKSRKMVRYLEQTEAINIDKDLFERYRFSVDQLMELAGQSCAVVIAKCYPLVKSASNNVLICCGPGNNGGDGLVCARHLKLFGYAPEIYYPKRTSNRLYENLLHQCTENDIPIVESTEKFKELNKNIVIIDALFGFSFKPPVRDEFVPIMNILKSTVIPICSIDIPSGWNVENGPSKGDINPETLISLTAPKMCARHFKGKYHYLGGRFVPKKLEIQYDLQLPEYPGTDLVVPLS
ncbi:NAD(P)H-hydrate epimerase isoform X1 [Orussus abietinus]|uniref:NAD(P)H-hydrate epimerase isoform X1 n=1 Tax=Orussus abietinus TaxID=222816 RepID=UPI0006261966|nr:NAD(P)H-hydrate epimerase isoform X1 [Orussus abietinus]XP_012286866.2 NAD(P)H-hydrate epimerase isoform X1 [Orussus abietinus]XP_012286868.2 NAD(P)H-hydrate epimerase isoform X1 [Orussus abietinus]